MPTSPTPRSRRETVGREIPARSASPSQTSSFRRAQRAWTILNSLVVPPLPIVNSGTRASFSKRSTKRTTGEGKGQHRSSDIHAPADRRWHVRLHREVEKRIAQHAGDTTVFRPSIGELICTLETNSKQFPKKHGPLRDARAAEVTFADGITWRAVFRLDEETGTVYWLSLDPHDLAYKNAKRRM